MPEPVVARVRAADKDDVMDSNSVTQGVTRMTFTSGQKTVSGFAPSKDEKTPAKGATNKNVERVRATEAEAPKASGDVTKTPVRPASSADLARRGSESMFETPAGAGMVKNLSTADLTKSEVKLLKQVSFTSDSFFST